MKPHLLHLWQVYLTVILILISDASFSQSDSWVQKPGFNGPERIMATGIGIGNKGYIGLGYNYSQSFSDFWEYDPVTETWSQKADFGGGPRHAAASFAIGNKGYVGTGSVNGDAVLMADLYEYDPALNVWTKKADFPGEVRTVAQGFSIGQRGYIGLGRGAALYGDFWEYNPNENKWSKKADFGGGPRYATSGFSIGQKGYIGTGTDFSSGGYTFRSDFWEYDPYTDSWTRKADFGGGARELAIGFSIYNRGYIGTGLSNYDLWEYNPSADTWLRRADATDRNMGTGFSVAGKGYMGTGSAWSGLKSDLWEYTPLLDCSTIAASLVTGPASPSPVNTSINLSVAYTSGNVTNATINWGDASAAQIVTNPASNFNVSHTYSSAGVYTVTSTLTNACGVIGPEYKYQYVVVYDPSGGFVTGGGSINSPAGAYRPDITLTGKAIFGFESKYQKGATIPTGNTEFKFQTGNLNFKSSNYDWLVVAGSKAQYKGTGTINGSGNYGFLLVAVDGDLGTSKSADLFRIKIWDKNNGDAIVYDNQYGSSDNADLITQIASGSIIIHTTKTNSNANNSMVTLETATRIPQSVIKEFLVTVNPNPATSLFRLSSISGNNAPLQIRVLDNLGRVVEVRSNVPANSAIYLGQSYRAGIYYIEAAQGDERRSMKVIKSLN